VFESIIFPAIGYGLSATSLPGPLQAYLLNVTLRAGWKRGLFVIFSPLITDGPIILVTVFLLGQLPDWAIQGIRIAGGLLLLWIAWGAWKALRSGATFSASENDESTTPQRVLMTAVAMNFFSPGPYLFWATVNGPLLLQAINTSPLAVVGMLLGFYGTFLSGMALLVILFHKLGKIDARMTQIILWITLILLLWFGTGLIAEAFGLLDVHRVVASVALIGALLFAGYRNFRARQA
jgi:threonine/homoserine/homoserine lactone efflux protein